MLHEQNAHARFEDVLGSTETEKYDELETKEPPISGSLDEKQPEPLKGDKDKHLATSTDGANDEKGTPAVDQGRPLPLNETIHLEPAALLRKKFKPTGLAMPPLRDARTFNGPWDGTQNEQPMALPAGFMPPSSIRNADGTSPETDPTVPHLHNLNSPFYVHLEKSGDYLSHHPVTESLQDESKEEKPEAARSEAGATLPNSKYSPIDLEKSRSRSIDDGFASPTSPKLMRYTTNLRRAPPKPWIQTLRPWNGRLGKANWFLVALRPFILYAYPSVLWSSLVYSLSVGWLIVLSESISAIYKNRDTYNFTSLQAGLVYVSPFIGGVLGTAVAGKVSDIIVRYMARRNGGVYEPEFRLVMAIPVAISTAVGLMGFGWSAQERDLWIVPTIFFGVISFGCSLGSTTAITFCVDSYRQYAGEALVTLNFSKNIFHGLVFSLFFATWLQDDGPKKTFLAIGGIQIACMFLTIPMYVYGKRARMWTVRKAFMEKF